MSGDTFTVLMRGHYDIENQRIACPTCGADRGLILNARPIDATTAARCPSAHRWQEERVSGEALHDLYLAITGQPTRTTTVRDGDEVCPREPCQTCQALKAEATELGLLASAAEGVERTELGARAAGALAAWSTHLAAVHLGAQGHSEREEAP